MNLKAVFDSFVGKRILIIGDVMLDEYIFGDVNRISPEAPVPVVHFKKKEHRLGGAANVALNINSLGATAIIASVIGKDNNAENLEELLKENGIDCSCLLKIEDRKTTCKTRIISHGHQLLRIDDEDLNDISDEIADQVLEKIKSCHNDSPIDAIIFEDYNKGVLQKKLIRELIDFANSNNIYTSVDPKQKNFLEYVGVSLFKPNLKELKEGLQIKIDGRDIASVENGMQILEDRIKPKVTFITLSENGVAIKNQEEFHHINAHFRNISDVSGAGDTVIAVATLCLTANIPIKDIAEIANLAGGIVCEKIGVVSIEKSELFVEAQKLFSK